MDNLIIKKRKKILSCDIHRSIFEKNNWVFFIGLADGKPCEIFGGDLDKINLARRTSKGKIIRRVVIDKKYNRQTFYNLAINKKNDVIVRNIAETFANDDFESLTRLISVSLAYGTPIKVLIKQLRKSKNSTLSKFSKAIARVLTKYLDQKDNFDIDFSEEKYGAENSRE